MYKAFFDVRWHLLLIEGWFPSINDFIQLARSNNPNIVVLFYCLDPAYPGLNIISQLDVDGYLTNSELVLKTLEPYAPTLYLMLAADPQIMQHNTSLSRDWAAVYVGAGGNMLSYKPFLSTMLSAAIPFGLRLYGSHWEDVPDLRSVWGGILPMELLASAYSSAHVVLASTILDQGRQGMINNRIFEALSCGAVVISDDWPVLRYMFGDLLLFANTADDVRDHISYILSHPEEALKLRIRGREKILSGHTWSHRAVELLSFYRHLASLKIIKKSVLPLDTKLPGLNVTGSSMVIPGNRPLCPMLAVIVSAGLEDHSDFIFIESLLMASLAMHYIVFTYSQNDWFILHNNHTWISQFQALLIVCTPYDDLDRSVSLLPAVGYRQCKTLGNICQRYQKRSVFWIGVDTSLVRRAVDRDGLQALTVSHYEVAWYRDPYELNILLAAGVKIPSFRLQHAFGVWGDTFKEHLVGDDSVAWSGVAADAALTEGGSTRGTRSSEVQRAEGESEIQGDNTAGGSENRPLPTLFLCYFSVAHLCTSVQRNKQHSGEYALLLYGGSWSQWLELQDVVGYADLHRTFFVPSRHQSSVLHRLKYASRLVLMSPEGFVGIPAEDISQVRSGQKNLLQFNISTVEDSIWPITACVQSGTLVHLLQSNEHLISVSQSGCNLWDKSYMMRGIAAGIARMNGLARSHSSVFVKNADISELDNINLIESGVYLLNLTMTNFVLGLDGQCCFIYENETLGCYFRSDVMVGINIILNRSCIVANMPNDNVFTTFQSRSIDINVELRGIMFLDPVYSLKHTFEIMQDIGCNLTTQPNITFKNVVLFPIYI